MGTLCCHSCLQHEQPTPPLLQAYRSMQRITWPCWPMRNFCLRRKIRPALQGLANQQHGQMPNNACYQWAIIQRCKKVKVAHTRLPRVRYRSWSWFLAVSLQVTWVINPAVGCHYFLPGLKLASRPLRGLLPISLLGEHRHDGCEQFAWDLPDSAAAAIWTRAILRLSPAS